MTAVVHIDHEVRSAPSKTPSHLFASVNITYDVGDTAAALQALTLVYTRARADIEAK